jgi:hypothetical protein
MNSTGVFATWGNPGVEPDEGKGISWGVFFVRSEARRTTAAITA